MNGIDLIKKRRSIRKYKQEIIEKEIIEKIIDVSRFSPSWANYQITRYNVITDEEIINKISEKGVKGFNYNIKTLKNTKNLLVLSYIDGKSGKIGLDLESDWSMFDVGIACQTFCLAAFEFGIGTCIFGVIDPIVIGNLINLNENEKVAAVITFGYPLETPVSNRKEVEELVRYYE